MLNSHDIGSLGISLARKPMASKYGWTIEQVSEPVAALVEASVPGLDESAQPSDNRSNNTILTWKRRGQCQLGAAHTRLCLARDSRGRSEHGNAGNVPQRGIEYTEAKRR